MIDTMPYLKNSDFPQIKRNKLETLQVNLGYLCNQQCLHCHVDASPRRTEIMQRDNIDAIIAFVDAHDLSCVDLTGGAPEMNPDFRYLVKALRSRDVRVIDRCNLTILLDDNYLWLTEFLAEYNVEVVASLPCYLEENVDAQRGKGVFDDSILGLQKLNSAGYGVKDSLLLDLVYNPQGANLPPEQSALVNDYKKILLEKYGIYFNHLYTITNMPIKRFGSSLISNGEFDAYMKLLKDSYIAENLDMVMCKNLISVDWQGYVYDCDFNQMLGLNSGVNQDRVHLNNLLNHDFNNEPIAVMDHCYGCTAGKGSSCGGALS